MPYRIQHPPSRPPRWACLYLPHWAVLEQQTVQPIRALRPVEERRWLGTRHDASPVCGQLQAPVVTQPTWGGRGGAVGGSEGVRWGF